MVKTNNESINIGLTLHYDLTTQQFTIEADSVSKVKRDIAIKAMINLIKSIPQLTLLIEKSDLMSLFNAIEMEAATHNEP